MPRSKSSLGLSHRESQVIELAGRGLTDAAIAKVLGISESTVTTYWERVRLKYGQHSRTELVLHFFQEANQKVLQQLRAQNRELAARLREAENRSSFEILEDVADAVILVDGASRIVHANPAAEALFGYPPGGLEARDHDVLVPRAERKEHACLVAEFFSNPTKGMMGEHLSASARRKSGQQFAIHASLTPMETMSGPRVLCIVREAEPDPSNIG